MLFARSLRALEVPGTAEPLLWQWYHPSHLLGPSGAVTANGGGVAMSWLFSSNLLPLL